LSGCPSIERLAKIDERGDASKSSTRFGYDRRRILKSLESAKSEAEMLAMADKFGVTRAFFNAGSVVDLGEKPLPKKRASRKR
jgi:hypothetical protein